VVENRPGANGVIGSQAAFGAPADGQTILIGTIDTQAINGSVYTNLSFQPASFLAVAPIARVPMVFAGSKKAKAQSFPELVEIAKKSDTNYGHWGVGSLAHLATEMLKQQAGISNMQGIPYQGNGPSLQAALAGEIDMVFMPLAIALANVERLNIFGLVSANRSPNAKQIPTMAEVGYPIDADAWLGVFVPPKTPRPVVEALHKAVTAVVSDPETNKRLLEFGVYPQTFASPDAYAAWVAAEQSRWSKFIQSAAVKLTQ
jgi:tripartite-type tricarboxylate transporter receptor subunit TctC